MDTFMNASLDMYLQAYVGTRFSVGNLVHLFTNNIVPAPTDTLGMYTEATYSGYGAVSPSPWTAASGGSGGTSSAPGSPCVFNPGTLVAPQDCYGWYLTDDGGLLVGAGLFAAGPLNMGGTTTGLTITVTLTLT